MQTQSAHVSQRSSSRPSLLSASFANGGALPPSLHASSPRWSPFSHRRRRRPRVQAREMAAGFGESVRVPSRHLQSCCQSTCTYVHKRSRLSGLTLCPISKLDYSIRRGGTPINVVAGHLSLRPHSGFRRRKPTYRTLICGETASEQRMLTRWNGRYPDP
jgi:hypothetical protein